MKRKVNEEQIVEMIKKDAEYQAETLRLSEERTRGRKELIENYCTIQNFYIRKKKYEEAMSKDLSKKI